jgi:PadR family transcriptional regulator PadR
VLEYCILCILSRKEAYASNILDELKAANMLVVEGTLYPLLIRQKNQGLLSYRWEESPQGPPRKYYVITDKGRAQLAEMDAAWQEMVQSIDTLKK